MNDYLKYRQDHINKGRPLPEKKKTYINRVSPKRAAKLAEQKKEYELQKKKQGPESTQLIIVTSLDQWFVDRMNENVPVCWECGMEAGWLKTPGYEKIWKACQAHILPKKKSFGFPSIATNPINHMVLFPSWGGHLCGCHGFYDSGWYNATTMKIWSKVLQRFKLLYPLIADNEKKNIPEALLPEIKSIML